MKTDELREMADSFVAFQLATTELRSPTSGPTLRSTDLEAPKAPGEWLRRTLGLALTSVGLGFGSAPATSRYLAVIDSRTAADMRSWPAQYSRSWLRNNRSRVGDSENVERLISADRPWRSWAWRQILANTDLTFGFWGPDHMRTTPKLQRAMSLFVLGRTVEIDLGRRAAFSCLVAANPHLGGSSVLSLIGRSGARGMEEAGWAVDAYLGSR